MTYKTNEKSNNAIYFKFTDITKCRYEIEVELASDNYNCKLSYIHNIGNLDYIKDDKSIMECINAILGYASCKGMVFINTISERIYNIIKNNYHVYYAHEVPIGYGGSHSKYQYHIGIKNHINTNSYCKKPKKLVDKDGIKSTLLQLLKSKRRKTDYVDEFINSINI